MTNSDLGEDLIFIANIPVQAEFPRQIQKQAAGGISLYMNATKKILCILNKRESVLL